MQLRQFLILLYINLLNSVYSNLFELDISLYDSELDLLDVLSSQDRIMKVNEQHLVAAMERGWWDVASEIMNMCRNDGIDQQNQGTIERTE